MSKSYLCLLYDLLRQADERWSRSVQEGRSWCPHTARVIFDNYKRWIIAARDLKDDDAINRRLEEAESLTLVSPEALERAIAEPSAPMDEVLKPKARASRGK